jgi:lipocalin
MKPALAIVGILLVGVLIALNADKAQSYLTTELQEPVPVPHVDLAKYLGAWYEQSVIPYYFERNCIKTIANYSLNPDGKSVKVYNTCVRNGQLVSGTGKAVPEDSTNAKLKVEFL